MKYQKARRVLRMMAEARAELDILDSIKDKIRAEGTRAQLRALRENRLDLDRSISDLGEVIKDLESRLVGDSKRDDLISRIARLEPLMAPALEKVEAVRLSSEAEAAWEVETLGKMVVESTAGVFKASIDMGDRIVWDQCISASGAKEKVLRALRGKSRLFLRKEGF